MKVLKYLAIFLGVLFFTSQILADTQSPVVFVNNIATRMTTSLSNNKARLKQAGVVHQLVNQQLIPYIDLDRISGSVVGRQYWSSASPQQRNTFIKEFTKYVTNTYSSALAAFDNDRVRVYPFRGNFSASDVVRVNSVVVRRSGQTIPISYNLIRSNGSWKIYDFSIENVSMTESYRSQFSDVLAHSGLNGLIQRLKQRSH